MRALALDFDGVISDSAREAYVVALRTFARVWPEADLGAPADEEDAALYERFLELMPLGNRAEDYGISLQALERGRELADQAAYDAFRTELEPAGLRRFHKEFYRVRRAWSEVDPAGWLERIGPYPGILDLLRRRSGDVELAIATAKDRHSVASLLASYGVGDLFPEGRVHDKETGVSKQAHIRAIAADVACPVTEVTFVDDKVNHLVDVAETGARCLLAGWGYNGEREWKLAEAAGHPVVGLAEFEAALFGTPG